jgi:hypothetical protein
LFAFDNYDEFALDNFVEVPRIIPAEILLILDFVILSRASARLLEAPGGTCPERS